ncbi:hypothetical protein F4778DRAFT_772050 [Xylariomycetidae sp. FL2044]|nr:hypothetical protein F4778DRAFT_772050 [Xylariomycetidae sp. FL2044]
MAELALGIVGAVDVCLRYGRALVETCQAAQHADTQLGEARLRIEACWLRIQTQLSVLRSIAASLDDQHRDINLRVLDVLLSKLRAADSRLNRVSESQNTDATRARKAKFALLKDGLTEAINELEEWQGVFDPTWFLIMKMATPEVDEQLEVVSRSAPYQTDQHPTSAISAAQHIRRVLRPSESSRSRGTIFLPPDGLMPGSFETVKFSPVSTAVRAGNQQRVLLDPMVSSARSATNAVLKDSRSLANKLRHADPFTFGLLECKGLLKEDLDSNPRYSFVFRLPPTCKPPVQSLRGRLLEGPEYDSLTSRIDLARQLVRAVSYMHVYDFVHKNIRPDTILLLSSVGEEENKAKTGRAKETAVLVGFDAFRSADGNTNRVGDDSWEKNLYRHPSRQGSAPQTDYDMRHDVGGPLVHGKTRAIDVKTHLIGLARGKLRRRAGTRYSRAVETCLTCLDDDGSEDFGDAADFADGDGIAVGARYVEKVVARLADIVI